MNNNSDICKEPTVELSLTDVFLDLLSQWKIILIVAVLFAVVVPTLKLMRDNANFQTALVREQQLQQQQTSATVAETTEQALASLNDEDRAVVETLAQQQELLNSQTEYLNNSLLLNTNPAAQHTLVLSFFLSTNDDLEVLALADAYNTMLKSDGALTKIGKAIDPDASLATISDLCSVSYGTAPDHTAKDLVATVQVALPSDHIDVKDLAHTIENTMNDISTELSKTLGEHSLILFSQQDCYLYNETAVNKKQWLVNNINSNRAVVKSGVTALNASQKAVYEALVSITNDTEDEDLPSKDTGNKSEARLDTSTGALSNNSLKSPSFSVKLSIMGFLTGIVLYTICYIVFVATSGLVGSESTLSEYANCRLLGGLYYPITHKGLSWLFHSNFIDKHRYARKGNIDEQISKTISVIETVCKHASKTNVCVLSFAGACRKLPNILDNAITELSARGIHMQVVPVDSNTDERTLSTMSSVIYLVSSNAKARDIWKMTRTTRSYDVVQLGCIYVREY